MAATFDLIIIGAGPGGYEAAVEAAREGKQVLVIERSHFGGTCLNEGCIPTKCLCHSAEVLDEVRQSAALGVQTADVQFSLQDAMARKDGVVEKLRAGIEALMKTPGITFVQGVAKFKVGDAHTVIVGDEEAGAPARDDIGFALPKEGFTIAFDEMVIAKDAKRKDLAYAFINYIYDGDVAAANMDYIQGPNPVKPGIDQLDEGLRNIIVLKPEQLKRGQVLKGFDDKPAVMELYNKAWDKIKATGVR